MKCNFLKPCTKEAKQLLDDCPICKYVFYQDSRNDATITRIPGNYIMILYPANKKHSRSLIFYGGPGLS
jgi:hypothetical protein